MKKTRSLNPRNWRLRTRLVFILISLLILSLIIANGLGIQSASTSLSNNISVDYRIRANSRSTRVADILTERVRLLQMLTTNDRLLPALRSANSDYPPNATAARARVENLDKEWAQAADDDFLVTQYTQGPIAQDLRNFLKLVPGQGNILFTDMYGALIATTQRTTHLDQYNEDWWQHTWNDGKGQIYIGQMQMDDSSGTPGIVLAIPINSTSTNLPIGILRGLFTLEEFQQLLTQYRGPEQPQTIIVDSNNQIIASVDPADTGKAAPFTAPMNNNVTNITDSQGNNLLVASTQLPNVADIPAIRQLGWRIVVWNTTDIALAPVHAHVYGTLIAAIIILIVATATVFVFGTRLARPITQLADAARANDLAMLAQKPIVDGQDEVGELAKSLHDMAQRLQASQEKIEVVNRGLEATVAERTAELNSTLQQQQDLLKTQSQLLEQIAAMSTPVLPIIKGVVVVPLIGTLDQGRTDMLSSRLLEGVEQEDARVILLDITGVPVVDSYVAAALLRAVNAARLLGAQSILVGVRPEIAQTLVSIGVDLSSVSTTASLREGLARAQTLLRSN